jgi:hypothetical protein
MIAYPISDFGFDICLLAMGFFGRGYFVAVLIYLTEIGGDKFRSWSLIVVFAIWGFSSFALSLEKILHFSPTLWIYLITFLPFLVGSLLSSKFIDPSPLKLYTKSTFSYYNNRKFYRSKNNPKQNGRIKQTSIYSIQFGRLKLIRRISNNKFSTVWFHDFNFKSNPETDNDSTGCIMDLSLIHLLWKLHVNSRVR